MPFTHVELELGECTAAWAHINNHVMFPLWQPAVWCSALLQAAHVEVSSLGVEEIGGKDLI